MFLHVWALIVGAAAISLPVAVHFLTKPRPVRFPLSTLRFLREAIHLRRARHRLRDVLVLALRTLAVLLTALAMARPQAGRQPLISDAHSGTATRVVVLDVSQSMAAVQGGVTALERARSIAASHLRYRPGLSANLILAGAHPHPILTEPSQNFEALRDALAEAQARPERLDVNRAITMAAEMLTPVDGREAQRLELVVVSDFQRANWARADLASLPPDTQIQLESVAPDEPLANLAVLQAGFRGRTSAGRESLLEVEVGNYSPTRRSITVEVAIGNATYRLEGACAAGRRTTLTQEILLPEAGWQLGLARLTGVQDALTGDDQRSLVAQVGSRPLYALISRQPSHQYPSSSHYLECGLVPDVRVDQQHSAQVIRMSPGQLNRQALAAADLIALDHTGKLLPDELTLLAGLLRRGHPLLYVASEVVDATNLQELTERAGTDLQMPVDFAPPTAGDSRRDLFLASVRDDAPPFNVFGENTAAIVGSMRFAGGLESRRRVSAIADDVLATYNDGTACLVRTSSGAGTLTVLNADLNRSSLPRMAAFVPLLDQLVQQMLEQRHSETAAVSGEPLVVRLPGSVEEPQLLRVAGPTEQQAAGTFGELSGDGTGVVWKWQSAGVPGIYRVLREDETILALPVHLTDEESQLENLSADVLENRLAAGHAVQYRSASVGREQRDVLWTWILTVAVLSLLGELSLLLIFRS